MSALVVVVLAAWVFTPILLINYPTAFADIPALRDLVDVGAKSGPRAAAPSITVRKPEEVRDLAIERPPEQLIQDNATAPTTRKPDKAAATAEPTPLPTEAIPPGPTLASASTSTIPASPGDAPVAAIAPTGLMAWPTAVPPPRSTDDAEPVAAPDAPPVDFGRVPLPPRRPDASPLAQLGTPLPRPRPTEAPPAEAEKTISDAEQQLFDRLSAPN